jgi:NDP-sugar pyrophosphorylase family protein
VKAILLAAGEGSRLRPLTASKPKPMIRAANKPIAQYAVEALVQNGVTDITFVLGYHRAKVQSYFQDGNRFGARISYVFQDALLGTANAFATTPRPDGLALVLGADNVVDAALIKSLLGAPGKGSALVVHHTDSPSRYGVVTLNGDVVTRIVEKPKEPRSDWVSTGVYRLGPAAHDLARSLAATGPTGLPEVLQARIDQGDRVEAVKSEDLWADAVYPWDLLRVQAEILRRHAHKPPALPGVDVATNVLVGAGTTVGAGSVLGVGTCVGANVEIGAHCVIENSVIYDDARIGAGSILQNSIVGEGTRLGPRATAIAGACDVRTSDGWHALDDFGSVIGEDAEIGGNVTFLPGTILGNKTKVAHSRTVSGTVPDSSRIV